MGTKIIMQEILNMKAFSAARLSEQGIALGRYFRQTKGPDFVLRLILHHAIMMIHTKLSY
jgi:hypothetical protein